jgi:hypothetical protein
MSLDGGGNKKKIKVTKKSREKKIKNAKTH